MKTALAALALALFAPLAAAQEAARAAAPTAAAASAKPARLALVIGNANYKDAPLVNPGNDAADVAKALEASGFTVMKRENATLREMHLALREFGDRLGRQSTGLFYFSGHGLQVRGRNYLMPVDADIAREDEVAFQALELGAVMEKLDSAKNPVNIVILDACRNNPFGSRLQASVKGLAQVDAPPGTLIAFATAPGSTAADGTGRNGLYTNHLVRQIAQPGLAIEEVFKATRSAVRTESKNTQIPWESTSLESPFAFRAAPPPPPPTVVAAAKPSSAAPSVARAVPASIGAPPSFVPGDRWTYRIVNKLDGSERNSVTRVARVQGDEVSYANGNVGDTVGNLTRVTRSDGRVELLTPSNQFYVFPLKQGSTWDLKAFQEIGERQFDLQVKLTIGVEEEVQAPAGKFRALRIQRVTSWKQRNSKAGGVNTWTYWYNSAVKRFVLAETTNVTTDGKTIQHERVELVSYEVK
jgi:Caspase domain